ENAWLCGPLAQRRLRSCRLRLALGLDRACIAIPREICQLGSQRSTNQSPQSLIRQGRQLTDLAHANRGKSRLGNGADAPHQFDRKVVKEGELGGGVDNDQAV